MYKSVPSIHRLFLAVGFLVCVSTTPVSADWPMWRNDSARTANTQQRLSDDLTLHWTLSLPTPRPAWPSEQGKVHFDASYEPVIAGGRLFVPSMVNDHVTAYDLATGKQLWRFFTDGPVRFAPVVHGDRLLAASDDGYLYCLSTSDGTLLWKYCGGPSDRKLLGNDRLISMWPARGAPVTYGETVYFAAGIWPFMGVFVHAVDIASGEAVWTNSGSGSDYIVQQHNSPAFAGVAPQGYLAVNDQMVLVSGGRTVPAAYDRATGQLIYFRPGDRQLGKDQGGYEVMIGPGWFANRGGLHQLSDGAPRIRTATAILSDNGTIGIDGTHLVGLDTEIERYVVKSTDDKGKEKRTVKYRVARQWRSRLPKDAKQLHLQAAGQLLVSGADGKLFKLARPEPGDSECHVLWQSQIAGKPWRMLVSDERLVVVSEEGQIFCFGKPAQRPGPAPQVLAEQQTSLPSSSEPSSVRSTVELLMQQTDRRDGYAVLSSPAGLELAVAIAQTSQFHILLFEADAQRCQQWRQQLARYGLLGSRIAVVPERLSAARLAPYFAELVYVQQQDLSDTEANKLVGAAYSLLRPYSGTAVLGGTSTTRDALVKAYRLADQPGPTRLLPQHVVITRPGPLPNSGTWTAQNGNSGNTMVADEHNVKTPLGMLWFGGPPNREVLPRHGHGPTPQVIGGRLFIEGRDMLRAVDVYTGRLIWQRTFKNVGIFYDNTDHHPGAGAIGGNFVTTSDSVYLVWGRRCLRLDPATGETIAEFHLPPSLVGQKPYWGYIAVSGDYLIAGSTPMLLLALGPGQKAVKDGEVRNIPLYSQFGEGSRRMVVLDRFSGDVKWKRDARFNFRHNAITAGDGKLFCLDGMTKQRLAFFRRRGQVPVSEFSLHALDLATGETLWESTEDAFGTWLAYDPSSQMLLQAGSKNRDRSADEIGKGMAMHSATTGQLLWRNDDEYGGPPMLFPDKIITQGAAFSLHSGERLDRQHPLTEEPLPWKFTRNYGCCTAIGCPNLLTFRSAAAGYFDLHNDGGTGNFGGFRASCTANLLAADGVLSAPDYTRTCTCSYQNQCSLALTYMPDAEMWTFNDIKSTGQRVTRLGINFGAPGDRRTADGTLWLDFPSVGGPSPDVPLTVSGDGVTYQRDHTSLVHSIEPSWVFASRMHGARKVRLRLASAKAAGDSAMAYQVKLYLAPPSAEVLTRCRQVQLQGKTYELWSSETSVEDLKRGVVRTFDDVPVGEHLQIEFLTSGLPSDKIVGPVVCGVEVLLQ